MYTAWFDGACVPKNPGGYATWGFLVHETEVGKLGSGFGCAGHGDKMSCNVAEYAGVIGLMEWLLEHGLEDAPITVYGDSNMVVQQMSRRWGNEERMKRSRSLYAPFFLKALDLLKKFTDIRFQWIPRERNGEADRLSRLWLEEHGIREARRHRWPSRARRMPGKRLQATSDGLTARPPF